MARNRKRAKERRNRRPASGQMSRRGVATAQGERATPEPETQNQRAAPETDGPLEHEALETDGRLEDEALETETPGPLEHAAPDVELADAQLAVGRPDLPIGGDDEPEDFLDEEEFRAEEDAVDSGRGGAGGGGDGGGGGGGELAPSAGAAPAAHRNPGSRLINFLKGSWRELQRVQWPDRRQVVQATGVVIGFVIVAGVYLGIADTLATRLMNFILK